MVSEVCLIKYRELKQTIRKALSAEINSLTGFFLARRWSLTIMEDIMKQILQTYPVVLYFYKHHLNCQRQKIICPCHQLPIMPGAMLSHVST